MIVAIFCPDCLHLRDRVWGCPTCNYTGWVDSVVPLPSDEDDLLEDAESVEPAPADEGGKRRRDYTTTPLSPSDVREVISTPPPARPAGLRSQRTSKVGTTVSVYKAHEAGLDQHGGNSKWYAVCEEHGTLLGAPTKRVASIQANAVCGWCEQCRDLLPPIPASAPDDPPRPYISWEESMGLRPAPPPDDCRICGATPPCVICYDLHEQPTPPPAPSGYFVSAFKRVVKEIEAGYPEWRMEAGAPPLLCCGMETERHDSFGHPVQVCYGCSAIWDATLERSHHHTAGSPEMLTGEALIVHTSILPVQLKRSQGKPSKAAAIGVRDLITLMKRHERREIKAGMREARLFPPMALIAFAEESV